MNDIEGMINDFQKYLNSRPDSYTPMTHESLVLRNRLVREEYQEVVEAMVQLGDRPTLEGHMELMKELCDLVYVCVGTCLAMGLPFTPFMREVCKSNLSKKGGEVVGGKLEKPSWYQPADMMKVFIDVQE